jgi:Escherichia/Staphylococcus phage prohead protease
MITRESVVAFSSGVTASGMFQGYAAVFSDVDSTGDVFLPGAFSKCLREKGASGIRMLWQHGRNSPDPVGEWTHIKEDVHGLFVEGQLYMELAGAKERLTLLRTGAVSGLSVHVSVPPGGAARDDKAGVRKLKEVDLWEISPVTWPANPRAKIRVVKCYEPLDLSGVKAVVREALRTVHALR